MSLLRTKFPEGAIVHTLHKRVPRDLQVRLAAYLPVLMSETLPERQLLRLF